MFQPVNPSARQPTTTARPSSTPQASKHQILAGNTVTPHLDAGQLAKRLKALYAGQQPTIGRHSLLEEAETIAAVDEVFMRTAQMISDAGSNTGYYRFTQPEEEEEFEEDTASGYADGYGYSYSEQDSIDGEPAVALPVTTPAQLEAIALEGKGLSVHLQTDHNIIYLKEKLGPEAKGGTFKKMTLALEVDKQFQAAQVVAAVTMRRPTSKTMIPLFDNEVAVCQEVMKLDNPPGVVNVHSVRVYTSKEGKPKVGIIMDLGVGGSLDSKMEKMSTQQVIKAVRGALIGLQSLHEAGILHLDPKPGNLLLNAEGEGMIGDFGCGCKLDAEGKAHYLGGDQLYRAPELSKLYKDRQKMLLKDPQYALCHKRLTYARIRQEQYEQQHIDCLTQLLFAGDDEKLELEEHLAAIEKNLESIKIVINARTKNRRQAMCRVMDQLPTEVMQIDGSYAKSEVFGWAVALEEALKAKMPQGAGTTLQQRLKNTPYPDDVPSDVKRMINLAKQTDPADRPTLEEFISVLAA